MCGGDKVIRSDELLVDSGCDMTTLPNSFRQYITEGPLGSKIKIKLAGKGQFLYASEPYRVHFMVEGIDGMSMEIQEICSFSNCRVALFAAMDRDLTLRAGQGEQESVGIDKVSGGSGHAKVIRSGRRKPVLKVLHEAHTNNKMACAAQVVPRASEVGGACVQETLSNLHRRFAHAKGQRIFETTKLAPMYANFVRKLWGAIPSRVFVTDSQPLMAWLESGTSKGDYGCQGRLDLLAQCLRIQRGLVRWVPTAQQRADKHTKLIIAPRG